MKYKLQDLIDMEHFQNLQDRLNEIYSFPSSIIDNKGNILTATAWQDICTQFHRKNKECEKLCIESDQYIKDHIHEANPAVSYRCPHGLVDNATPIIIDGFHYGNFFTGQFFLEEPNIEFFRAQARKYKFDEDAYLEAVKSVPIWTQGQLDSYLFFIKGLITVISESGLKKLKEIENRKLIEANAKKHESILKSAMDGYWLTDNEGRLLEVNNSYCRMSGYTEKELLTMRIADLEVVESPQIVEAHIQKIISQGSDRFESKHRRKDGTIFDVEVSTQFRPEENGLFVCFLRDITEMRQVEKSIKISEKKYRTLFENMVQGVFYQRADGTLIDFNKATLEMFGLTSEQFLGRTSLDPEWKVISEDGTILPGNKHPSMIALQTGKPVKNSIVGVYNPLKKQYNWLLVNAIPQIKQTEKKPYQVFVTLQDITDRKKAEEDLLRNEEEMQAIVDHSVDAIGVSQQGIHKLVNPAYVTMFGYKNAKDLIGKPIFELIAPDERKRIKQFVSDRIEGISVGTHYQTRGLKKDGTEFDMEVNVAQYGQEDNKNTLVILRDVTGRNQLEEQLRQSQKMESIGNLAGGIAHDFNNLLFPIIGMSEMLLEDLPEDSLEYENVEEIFQAGKRAGDLVNQILAFSRQSEHKMSPVRVQNVLEEVLKLSRSTIPTNIEILQDIQQNCGLVMADPTQIHQIGMNLITNAFHAVERKNGTIDIKLKEITLKDNELFHSELQPGQYIKLSVSDNGTGMSEKTIQQIFEPYFTTKGLGKGTGLGLAVLYGIVKEHKGEIDVSSKLGKGTAFNVYLPLMKKISEVTVVDNVVSTERGTERILVVDDEVSVAKLEGQMLSRLGYQVIVKTDSNDALNTFKENPNSFDLVISDMTMPDMTGDELAKEILSIKSDIPIIICTGFSERINKEQTEIIGVKGFLMKPVVKSDMAQMVRNVLDEVS